MSSSPGIVWRFSFTLGDWILTFYNSLHSPNPTRISLNGSAQLRDHQEPYVKLKVSASTSPLIFTYQIYAGLTYKISINFPANYPYAAPTIKFDSPCYHPNVDINSGAICLDILQDKWSAVYSVQTILLSLQSLLGGMLTLISNCEVWLIYSSKNLITHRLWIPMRHEFGILRKVSSDSFFRRCIVTTNRSSKSEFKTQVMKYYRPIDAWPRVFALLRLVSPHCPLTRHLRVGTLIHIS